jgi:hypothetical protein
MAQQTFDDLVKEGNERTKQVLLISFCFIVFGGLVYFFFTYEPKPTEYIPDKVDAFIMAKKFMSENLRSPSTAEYASLNNSIVKTTDIPDMWEVVSYVDSQNGFGAMVRTKFKIKMHVDRVSKKWTMIDIQTK